MQGAEMNNMEETNMNNMWLNNEHTFEDLDISEVIEDKLIQNISGSDNGYNFISDDPEDDAYIAAVAKGDYHHPMPKIKMDTATKNDSNQIQNTYVTPTNEINKYKLRAFANLMAWDNDLDNAGYIQAVVANKPGKAAVIKDLIDLNN
jgi:hypothetical protein